MAEKAKETGKGGLLGCIVWIIAGGIMILCISFVVVMIFNAIEDHFDGCRAYVRSVTIDRDKIANGTHDLIMVVAFPNINSGQGIIEMRNISPELSRELLLLNPYSMEHTSKLNEKTYRHITFSIVHLDRRCEKSLMKYGSDILIDDDWVKRRLSYYHGIEVFPAHLLGAEAGMIGPMPLEMYSKRPGCF